MNRSLLSENGQIKTWYERQKSHWNSRALTYREKKMVPHSTAFFVERRRREAVLPILTRRQNADVLDLGCGPGLWLEELHDRVAIGCDLSFHMISECRKHGFVRALVGDFEHLPFRKRSFDVVLCVNSLQYAGNPFAVLAEIARVLRPGGVAIVSWLNRWNVRDFFYQCMTSVGVFKRERRFSCQVIKTGLSRLGLRVKSQMGINLLPLPVDATVYRVPGFWTVLEAIEKRLRTIPLGPLFNETLVICEKD